MALAERPNADRTSPDLVGDSEQDCSENLYDDGSDSDDSDEDPTFTEALSGLSWLSVRKKPSRVVKSGGKCQDGKRRLEEDLLDEADETDLGDELNEVDQKSFDCVQTLVSAGKLEKLKVDQCKVYLRKYRLRLTGNKETLIERIKEHIRILNGGGEREYPPSSFFLNCKGDACMGDVVMFEQRVYEKYDLASRSGPPVGTRVITGRIVKESYGAAKQQHTFTIEVLWSKGEKPLPPLHPLLIKGRNLYRMKTLRQKWEDETLREKALSDKHLRGEAARNDREIRIIEKKMKQDLRGKRLPRAKNSNVDQAARATQLQNDNEKYHPLRDNQPSSQPDTVVAGTRRLESKIVMGAKSNHHLPVKPSMTNNGYRQAVRVQSPAPAHKGFETVHSQYLGMSRTVHSQHIGMSQTVHTQHHLPDKGPAGIMGSHHEMARRPLATQNYQRPPTTSWESVDHHASHYNQPRWPNFNHGDREYHQNHPVRQPCRYFAHGRCHYGYDCKFSHDR